MYTIVENARIVISLLKAHKIRHIVLSPGGSNIPIVQGVQDDPFFKCYSVVDERSAMYVAIGISLQTGEPVATSCTSAQATRNYVPGLTEAYYKHVPILAITMSKHPKYLGQEYMQCPIQTSLPIDAVKKSYSLPRISTEDDRQLCIRAANEAILELTHNGKGPVQLNIEALDTETWVVDEKIQLPKVRVIRRHNTWDTIGEEFSLKGRRTMILIGEHVPFTEDEKNAIEFFCENNNAFVYKTHISNYNGKYSFNAYPVLIGATPEYFNTYLTPQVVITLGGITGDYDCLRKLTGAANDLEVWRVNIDGDVVDTYGHLTEVFQMRIEDFFTQLGEDTNNNAHEYYNNWIEARKNIKNEEVDLPFSNMYAAQILHSKIPANSYLNFAILNSFRSWLHFDVHPTIKSFCNVGAFGIDGGLSTMLGQSFTTDELCFMIIGDLSFYYDMNSIALRHIKNNVRILLVNNNGGAEFKINTIHLQTDVSRYIAADNHFKNARAWALDNGFIYYSAKTKEEFIEYTDSFVSTSDKPIILEIFTKAEDQRNALSIAFKSYWVGTSEEILKKKTKDGLKKTISTIIGEDNTNNIISNARRLLK